MLVCFALLGMKPSTLNMLGQHSPLRTTQPEFTFKKKTKNKKQPWVFSELENGNLKTIKPFCRQDSKESITICNTVTFVASKQKRMKQITIK